LQGVVRVIQPAKTTLGDHNYCYIAEAETPEPPAKQPFLSKQKTTYLKTAVYQ
jgi:hypothetical protein